jgi:hypothetical protein
VFIAGAGISDVFKPRDLEHHIDPKEQNKKNIIFYGLCKAITGNLKELGYDIEFNLC